MNLTTSIMSSKWKPSYVINMHPNHQPLLTYKNWRVNTDNIIIIYVFGDSLLTNQKCIKLNHCKDPNTRPTLQRIQLIMDKFEILEIFHIKKENNTLVDDQANKGVNLVQGELVEGGISTIRHIPWFLITWGSWDA